MSNTSKGLEKIKSIVAIHFGALGFLNPSENEQILKDRDKVLNALNELKEIKEAKPSEALEILYNNAKMDRDRIEEGGVVTYAEEIEYNEGIKPYYDTIKQALIKSQEQEKVLKIIKEKGLDYHSLSAIKQAKDFEEFKELTENLITKFLDYTQEEFDLLKRYFK